VQPEPSSPSAPLRDLALAWRDRQDEAAARELIARLHPQVAAIARRHLPRRSAVEDLTQEIFVKLFARLDRYDPALPLENWTSRIAVNVCLDRLRAEKRRPELRWSELTEEQAAALERVLAVQPQTDSADRAAAADLFERLLAMLPAEDRIVMQLTLVEQLGTAEIAARTGWSRTLVKVRAFRARQRLRRALSELEGEQP
jgi:RNA polymerase sigma-70 factor (ECF subfamily)